jgi:hypothetical protein
MPPVDQACFGSLLTSFLEDWVNPAASECVGYLGKIVFRWRVPDDRWSIPGQTINQLGKFPNRCNILFHEDAHVSNICLGHVQHVVRLHEDR